MDVLLKHFGDKAVSVRGGMSDIKKQESVDRFQNDEKCTVFVGQIKAAGVGLTLTKAEIVIMNSLDWVPGNHEQAEDRSHRIGQTKTVNIYYMLIDGTIDTMVWHVLKHKKKIINTIIGDNDILNDILKDGE
jgi:SWI/SNF-related matrix-associated actin-dependent regulator 1 of chromatin subfamily A